LRGLRSNNITLSGAERNIQLLFEKNKCYKLWVKQRAYLRSLLRILFDFCMLCDMKFKFALKIALPILLVLAAGTFFFCTIAIVFLKMLWCIIALKITRAKFQYGVLLTVK